jgi:hypothetical protein
MNIYSPSTRYNNGTASSNFIETEIYSVKISLQRLWPPNSGFLRTTAVIRVSSNVILSLPVSLLIVWFCISALQSNYNFLILVSNLHHPTHLWWRRRGRGCIAPTLSRSRHQMGWVVSVTTRSRFTPGTHCTGGWVSPTAGVDTEVRGKISCLWRGWNLDRPVVQTLYWLSYPAPLYTDYFLLFLILKRWYNLLFSCRLFLH